MKRLEPEPPELPPKYVYSKLDAGKNIRLVTLLPGKFRDPIRITIFHASLIPPDQVPLPSALWTRDQLQKSLPEGWKFCHTLDESFIFFDDKATKTFWTHPNPSVDPIHYQLPASDPYPGFEPKYEALSYTWGDSSKTDTVIIQAPAGSRSLGIGHNLAIALRHLRYKDSPRCFWIDAICINQEDLDERAEQVVHMPSIYKMAYRVVVWLGPEFADSKLACRTIKKLASQIGYSKDLELVFLRPGCTKPDWFRNDRILPFTKQQWQSLDSLFNRQWFWRLWTWQEIMLANRRAIIQCGSEQLEWTEFQRDVLYLYGRNHLPSPYFRHLVDNARRLTAAMDTDDVDMLLNGGAIISCSEPRDKVYGILGMTDPQFSRKIRPQYSLPKSEVYRDAVLAYIELYEKLDLMQQCSMASWEQGLPTWVPNWSEEISCRLLPSRYNFASGTSSSSTQFISPNTLVVTGTMCASIVKVNNLDANNLLEILEAKDRDPGSKYISGESMARAIASTFLANYCSDRFPASKKFPSLDTLEDIFLEERSTFKPRKRSSYLPDLLWQNLFNFTSGRTFFRTSAGYIGIGPNGSQPGTALLSTMWAIVLKQ